MCDKTPFLATTLATTSASLVLTRAPVVATAAAPLAFFVFNLSFVTVTVFGGVYVTLSSTARAELACVTPPTLTLTPLCVLSHNGHCWPMTNHTYLHTPNPHNTHTHTTIALSQHPPTSMPSASEGLCNTLFQWR